MQGNNLHQQDKQVYKKLLLAYSLPGKSFLDELTTALAVVILNQKNHKPQTTTALSKKTQK